PRCPDDVEDLGPLAWGLLSRADAACQPLIERGLTGREAGGRATKPMIRPAWNAPAAFTAVGPVVWASRGPPAHRLRLPGMRRAVREVARTMHRLRRLAERRRGGDGAERGPRRGWLRQRADLARHRRDERYPTGADRERRAAERGPAVERPRRAR